MQKTRKAKVVHDWRADARERYQEMDIEQLEAMVGYHAQQSSVDGFIKKRRKTSRFSGGI